MAGAYCRFCDHRCFVERVIPAGPRAGKHLHMATCRDGAAFDRSISGYDHTTAINPRTRSEGSPESAQSFRVSAS